MKIYSLKNPTESAEISASFLGTCSPINNYSKIKRIGEGTYGIVYSAKKHDDETIVALKKIRVFKNSQNGIPISATREISLLKSLKHPNIVRLIQVVVGQESLADVFMVMEFCDQDMANILDNIITKKTYFNQSHIKCLLDQLLKGLHYLHSTGTIHRDLKMSNLLLNRDGILKIADFGLARIFPIDLQVVMTPKVVTLWYRAPELLFGEKEYTKSIDLWSVGCIFAELIQGKPLLPGKNEPNQVDIICQLLGTPTEKIWKGISKLPFYSLKHLQPIQPYNLIKNKFLDSSKETIDLIECFLTYDPTRRINSRNARKHDYFRESPRACLPEFLPKFFDKGLDQGLNQPRNDRGDDEEEIEDKEIDGESKRRWVDEDNGGYKKTRKFKM